MLLITLCFSLYVVLDHIIIGQFLHHIRKKPKRKKRKLSTISLFNTSNFNNYTGCIKKLNKSEFTPRLCKAPHCRQFFIEIGCLGTNNVV